MIDDDSEDVLPVHAQDLKELAQAHVAALADSDTEDDLVGIVDLVDGLIPLAEGLHILKIHAREIVGAQVFGQILHLSGTDHVADDEEMS